MQSGNISFRSLHRLRAHADQSVSSKLIFILNHYCSLVVFFLHPGIPWYTQFLQFLAQFHQRIPANSRPLFHSFTKITPIPLRRNNYSSTSRRPSPPPINQPPNPSPCLFSDTGITTTPRAYQYQRVLECENLETQQSNGFLENTQKGPF